MVVEESEYQDWDNHNGKQAGIQTNNESTAVKTQHNNDDDDHEKLSS